VGGQRVEYHHLDIRHLGDIYEALRADDAALPSSLLPSPPPSRSGTTRKSSGRYYTPATVIAFIVEQTVGPLLQAAIAHAEEGTPREGQAAAKASAVLRLKVLDPAVGCGSFLLEVAASMARFLAELEDPPSSSPSSSPACWQWHVVRACLYGVDLDPLAVDLARFSLWLSAVESGGPQPGTGEEWANLWCSLERHLRPGHALVGTRPAPGASTPPFHPGEREEEAGEQDTGLTHRCRGFHWGAAFPEVFFDRDGSFLGEGAGFDAVVGNPPYISAIERSRGAGREERSCWKEWKAQFASARGAYDLYVLFIEQSLRLVRRGGMVGVITPNKYLSAPYGAALRAYLTHEHTLLRLRDVSELGVFAAASVYPVVSIIRQGRTSEPYGVVVDRVSPTEAGEEARGSEGQTSSPPITHPSALLSALPQHLWGFLLSEQAGVLEKVQRCSERFEQVALIRASTSVAEADRYGDYLREGEGKGDEQEQCGWRVVNTGLIGRWVSHWGQRPLTHQHRTYRYPVLPRTAPVVSASRRSQFAAPKLIVARLARAMRVCVDEAGHYASMNTTFVFARPGGPDLFYLGALCHSRLLHQVATWYFAALQMRGGYFQFQAPQVRVLPIRRIAFATPPDLRARLTSAAAALSHEGDGEGVLALVRSCLAHQPEQSDVVHDILVFLARRVVAVAGQGQGREEQAAIERLMDRVVEVLYGLTDEESAGLAVPPPVVQ